MKVNRKTVGKQIQACRDATGLSQEQLAEKIGISTIFLSAIECGGRSPSLENFVKICNALEVESDVLLASVLDNGYKIKASKLSEIIENMESGDRQRILNVVETMINNP